MAKRFSSETKEKAKAMRAQGMSYVAIAEEIGCTSPCVRYWCDTQARVGNGGRADSEWKRVSKTSAYNNHYDGLRRTSTDCSELSRAERDAIIALYELARKISSETGEPYEVDHIKPVKDGGEHRIWNLRIVPRFMNRTGRPRI